MSQSLTTAAAKDVAARYVSALPFSVADDDLERARAHMMLAFSPAASPQLAACTPQSIGYCIALSALSGLLPGGPAPDVWLIPRRRKLPDGSRVQEANWQISARGYQRLARRAGWDLMPVLVYHGERFEITRGTSPGIVHVPDVDTAQSYQTIRLGYAVATGPDGRRDFCYLRKDQIDQRRAKAQDDTIWSEWPEEQALKTVAAYAGRRELFPCDPAARHAINADITEGQAQTVVGSQPAPQAALLPSDFEEAMGAPEDKPKTLPAAEAREFEKEMKRLGVLDGFVEEHGPPPWAVSLHGAIVDAIRKAKGAA